MKKHNHIQYTISLLLLTGLFSMDASAAVVNGTHWVIEPGDTLYKIARTLFPENNVKRTELRKQLISQNPQIFTGGANSISVGDKLILPAFAVETKKIKRPTPVKSLATDKTQSIVRAVPVKKTRTINKTTRNPKEVIGQVVINVGELSAENRGSIRQLSRRSKILRGDTISTGGQSTTQIRLKDGALLSLRPFTNMKIAEYRYNGRQDGTEQSIIELLKGGFRTITGAIGHINKQNYQVRTSVATIGIRGTHYTLMLCDANCRDDSGNKIKAGLYGGVSDGAVVIKNKTGTHRFNNDEFFQILSERAKPIRYLMPPGILKTSPRDFVVKATEKDLPKEKEKDTAKETQEDIAMETEKDKKHKKGKKGKKDKISKRSNSRHRHHARHIEPGQPGLENIPELVADLAPEVTQTNTPTTQLAPNGSAMLIGFNHLNSGGNVSGTAVPVIISSGNNNEITLLNSETIETAVPVKVPLAVTEFADDLQGGTIRHDISMVSADGIPATLVPSSLGGNAALGVNWGRWNGQYAVLENGEALTTSQDFHFIYSEQLTTPTQLTNIQGTSSYNTITGGTEATDNLGNFGANTSITLDVNFTGNEITRYSVYTQTPSNGIIYEAEAQNIAFDDLVKSFSLAPAAVSPQCTSCTGDASVAFVGNLAEGAMNSYQITNTATNTAVSGTALLTAPGGIIP